MGIFRPFSVFGRKAQKPAPVPFNRRNAGQTATFEPVGKATFDPVGDATFEVDFPKPRTDAEEEASVQQMLEREGYASAEASFLSGEIKFVISSCVRSFQYLFEQNQLVVEFLDSSSYLYEDVPVEEALIFYRAGSPGGAVWDNLRVRGTVFGFRHPYRLIQGNRIWHAAGKDSQARHEAIPKSGEVTRGYHPSLNWQGVKGPMGAKGGGVDLNKRGGSKKVAYFTPAKAKAVYGPRP